MIDQIQWERLKDFGRPCRLLIQKSDQPGGRWLVGVSGRKRDDSRTLGTACLAVASSFTVASALAHVVILYAEHVDPYWRTEG